MSASLPSVGCSGSNSTDENNQAPPEEPSCDEETGEGCEEGGKGGKAGAGNAGGSAQGGAGQGGVANAGAGGAAAGAGGVAAGAGGAAAGAGGAAAGSGGAPAAGSGGAPAAGSGGAPAGSGGANACDKPAVTGEACASNGASCKDACSNDCLCNGGKWFCAGTCEATKCPAQAICDTPCTDKGLSCPCTTPFGQPKACTCGDGQIAGVPVVAWQCDAGGGGSGGSGGQGSGGSGSGDCQQGAACPNKQGCQGVDPNGCKVVCECSLFGTLQCKTDCGGNNQCAPGQINVCGQVCQNVGASCQCTSGFGGQQVPCTCDKSSGLGLGQWTCNGNGGGDQCVAGSKCAFGFSCQTQAGGCLQNCTCGAQGTLTCTPCNGGGNPDGCPAQKPGAGEACKQANQQCSYSNGNCVCLNNQWFCN